MYKKWLSEIMSKATPSFLGGFWIKRLEYELAGHTDVCPICLGEEMTISLILSCGHTICSECLVAVHGVSGKRGTFLNIIHHLQEHEKKKMSCPICRNNDPYNAFDEFHVIPLETSTKFLTSINH
jgi:hypothetical protein